MNANRGIAVPMKTELINPIVISKRSKEVENRNKYVKEIYFDYFKSDLED